ncbi:MAG: hypothetical protein KGL62_00990 [Bradyrhizobium sp.]|uniref:ferritin-like domain-containing protein n=1 Tax=Bradyrhizobium sp. TaxID=376 RepID=UPI00238485F2|nr:ferritin-like domain-containing protein [Bradyrhizobium sp.]MDE2600921.1 hypothetical protein [Bradyrhizobium sp.]
MPDIPARTNPKDPNPQIVEVTDPVYSKKRPDMSWRDHLVMLLTSGAEVEHALMVQYLFAAYSINSDQPTEELRALVEGWRASILSVAREEMGHLLTVQNVLVLLGAPISFHREMMPWDHQFYPFPFSLEPLSIPTLQCFIYAEMPRLAEIEHGKIYPETPKLLAMAPGRRRKKAAPSSIGPRQEWECIQEVKRDLAKRFGEDNVNADLHQVGELYHQIIDLISDPRRIPDSEFNEASYDMQADWNDWGRGYKPQPRELTPDGDIDEAAGARRLEAAPEFPSSMARRHAHVQVERAATRAQAVKALRAISAQGEAPHLKADDTGEPSHFERFVQIYEEYKALQKNDPSWKATYDIPRNPTTREDFARLNPKKTTYIPANLESAAAAHLFAQLFNQRYRLLLNYLAHSFRLGRSQPLHQPGRRGMVMHRAFGEMYHLKTIAGLLVRLSLHDHKNPKAHAAPPFELPYTLGLPLQEIDIWRQHRDLIAVSQHTCNEVFRLAGVSASFKKEVGDIGGDIYLNTLIRLDNEAQRWIGAILAGRS